MRVVETTVYSFNELSGSAKETVRHWYCRGLDSFWAEIVIEDAKEIASLMGWNIEVGYSGFWCQGDGAHFTGAMGYEKGCAVRVKSHAPKDEELHRIALAWQSIQKKNFYSLRATVKHRGNYAHEYCTVFNCEDVRDNYGILHSDTTEKEIIEIARDFMRWIYKQLESAYVYETSEENIAEMCAANAWQFTEDGKIFN